MSTAAGGRVPDWDPSDELPGAALWARPSGEGDGLDELAGPGDLLDRAEPFDRAEPLDPAELLDPAEPLDRAGPFDPADPGDQVAPAPEDRLLGGFDDAGPRPVEKRRSRRAV
jgi:hypothetical protein